MLKYRQYNWIDPPLNATNIIKRLEPDCRQYLDLKELLRHLTQSGILNQDQLDRLQDTSHLAATRGEKVTHLLQYIIPHGEKGLRILKKALRDSGELAPHPGHTHVAKRLEFELSGEQYIMCSACMYVCTIHVWLFSSKHNVLQTAYRLASFPGLPRVGEEEGLVHTACACA